MKPSLMGVASLNSLEDTLEIHTQEDECSCLIACRRYTHKCFGGILQLRQANPFR